jgi:hypothetical protein
LELAQLNIYKEGIFVLNTSRKTLINISAVIWIFGGLVLLLKGILLINAAQFIYPSIIVISAVIIAALLIGLIKGKLLMGKFCKKNIKRINNIVEPKIHQFFEPRFILHLSLMILTGFTLSKLAEGNYSFLLAVGCLDFALSTALLTSTSVFFQYSHAEQK